MDDVRLVRGLAIPASTTATARKDTHTMATTKAENLGRVISLDDVSKGRRGAVAFRNESLCSIIAEAFEAGGAAALTGMAVLRDSFESLDSYKNEKQRVGAEIRSHVEMLVTDGTLETGTKCSINWAPETGTDMDGVPQVSRR